MSKFYLWILHEYAKFMQSLFIMTKGKSQKHQDSVDNNSDYTCIGT